MNNYNNAADLINNVSELRRRGRDVAYLHIGILGGGSNVQIGELQQILEFKFGKEEGSLFRFDDRNILIMLVGNDNRQSLAYFDRAIYESFSREKIKVTTNSLDESGINVLAGLLDKLIPPTDTVARLLLRRMRRSTNCALVLDDDIMVIKTMEYILKGFGIVHTAQTPERFLELYKEYAPNVVFVDIHLRGEKGQNIVRQIKSEIDPYVHAVMISSDGTKDTILEVREAGASGFIVKPFNLDSVYKYLAKAPTFIPKRGSVQ